MAKCFSRFFLAAAAMARVRDRLSFRVGYNEALRFPFSRDIIWGRRRRKIKKKVTAVRDVLGRATCTSTGYIAEFLRLIDQNDDSRNVPRIIKAYTMTLLHVKLSSFSFYLIKHDRERVTYMRKILLRSGMREKYTRMKDFPKKSVHE